MRKQSEKKTKATSIRLTEHQFEVISHLAEEKGMTVSSFLGTVACHADKTWNPTVMVRVQNLVNQACEVCRTYAPEQAKQMEQEANKLWCI